MRRFLAVHVLFVFACSSGSSESDPPVSAPDISIDMEPGDNNWSIDLSPSLISFEALEKEQPFKGHFDRFEMTVDLDLNNPESGHIIALIDLTSIDAGNADRNKVLADSEMFYVREFPVAQFQSENITRISDDRFEARGELSIKGVSRNIVLPFTISQTEGNAIITAVYEMNRLDFNIGTGSFMSSKFVGYPVTVHIEIHARKENVEESLQ